MPVKNADLWRELVELAGRRAVKWIKIDGHAGIGASECCHALVKLAIARSGT